MSTSSPCIAVAVSGGADSVYTLLELYEAGLPVFAVHGIFGQEILHDFLVHAGLKQGSWPDASHLRIVDTLSTLTAARGIPFHVLDCGKEFLAQVIQPFVKEYAAGKTPNPCALCNARIKFGLLHEKSRELGASHLATGHYARLIGSFSDPRLPGLASPVSGGKGAGQIVFSAGSPALIQGADPLKDQSYFLALVPKEHLARSLFPLGERRKSDVLVALTERGIQLPQPGESQDVCFIPGKSRSGGDSYREFLPFMAERLGVPLPGPGPMCLENGQVIGVHKGLWHYTEGQRKGLGIGWKEPLHVLAKEGAANRLRLGPGAAMYTGQVLTERANVLVEPALWPETVLVKTRYREEPKRAAVRVRANGSLRITFVDAERSVAPGQLAAVYIPLEGEDGGRAKELQLVAGGIIERSGE